MGWMSAAEVAAMAVVLLMLLLPVGLYLRRRWLSTEGSVFDCALRLREHGRGTGWATGVARYEGDELQWFRTFSFDMRPKVVLMRDRTTTLGHRPPTSAEQIMLFSEDEILQLGTDGARGPKTWELALNPSAATGLMSWLEAAPPGGDHYSGLGLQDQRW